MERNYRELLRKRSTASSEKDDVYEVEEFLAYKKRRVGKKLMPQVKVR